MQIWIANAGAEGMVRKTCGVWGKLSKESIAKGKTFKGAVDVYGKELGRVEHERSDCSTRKRGNWLKLINREVDLMTEVLKLGKSSVKSKKDDKETAGEHGEVCLFLSIFAEKRA